MKCGSHLPTLKMQEVVRGGAGPADSSVPAVYVHVKHLCACFSMQESLNWKKLSLSCGYDTIPPMISLSGGWDTTPHHP